MLRRVHQAWDEEFKGDLGKGSPSGAVGAEARPEREVINAGEGTNVGSGKGAGMRDSSRQLTITRFLK